ncbi:DNA internalization-related competence protein ComEC/Rec2 [Oceanospirillum linum]|uniref:DNA internalization-related competence protein ComEC/Rec2 n=1 Tax=Oceanospirillum linum TaxID=966 RepID=A0A1T1HEJ2_OCELI|nr:DNA internalization-related competence protein ComEC/Rec2 [Oceanospirillum linum]OOV88269.1 DNA internalization-related competence protein ComEC/Rec2 [Oceanospirillum linum]SEF50415.1 competence protein ComEC [Oleiphilus messinensis]SMP03832.1 competence protein ComEC [Oceanospirillum linum]
MWFIVVILGVLAGIVAFDWPPAEALLMLAFIALVLIRNRPALISVATGVGILAYLYTNVYLAVLLSQTLPQTLSGKDLLIQGRVEQVMRDSTDQQQLRFKVNWCQLVDETAERCTFQGSVVVNRYLHGLTEDRVSLFKARDGERWQFLVRLYPVRGLSNPGQSRYRIQQLGNGVMARGYIRSEQNSQRLSDANLWPQLLSQWRSVFSERADHQDLPLVSTLLTGDGRYLTDHHWQLLRATGTIHLVVVSGLHIGVLLGAGWFVLSLIRRVLPLDQYWQRVILLTAPVILLFPMLLIWPPGVAVARALLMALLVIFIRSRGFLLSPLRVLLFAVTLLLLYEPLYLLRPGFYYSVWAVFLLLIVISGGRHHGMFIRVQLVLMAGLLPVQSFWLNTPDLVSGLVNLVAIPLVSLLILPLALLQTILPVLPLESLLGMLEFLFWQCLLLGLELNWGTPVLGLGSGLLLVLLTLIWAFPAVPGRQGVSLVILSIGLYFVADIKHEKDRKEGFRVEVFDVGQGLAVRIRVADKQLIYDTGPSFRSGFQPVSLFLPPLLASEAAQIDLLVISHGDNDHAGGLSALTPFSEKILAGQPERLDKTALGSVKHVTDCHQGQLWQWEDTVFEVLYPPVSTEVLSAIVRSDNDRSCVLKVWSVSEPEKSILLTGDIGQQAESWLLASGQNLQAEWLVASHHGSTGGNSLAFLSAVRPKGVIYSAGFNNRYGHPAPEVQQRIAYLRSQESMGASEKIYREYNTADLGALFLKDDDLSGHWTLTANRELKPLRWRWQKLD